MKITKVSNPRGVVHYHNGQVYNPDGNFFKLTAKQEEFFSLPEPIQKSLQDRWSRVCQISDGLVECYLEHKDRWRLLREISGDREFAVQLLHDYIYMTRVGQWQITGRRAWALIAELFAANRDGYWPFVEDIGYIVQRSSDGISITVPGPVYGKLLSTDNYQRRLENISEKLSVIVRVSFPR